MLMFNYNKHRFWSKTSRALSVVAETNFSYLVEIFLWHVGKIWENLCHQLRFFKLWISNAFLINWLSLLRQCIPKIFIGQSLLNCMTHLKLKRSIAFPRYCHTNPCLTNPSPPVGFMHYPLVLAGCWAYKTMILKRTLHGTSLEVQWLRIHLPVQGTWVRPLVEDLRSHMPQGN